MNMPKQLWTRLPTHVIDWIKQKAEKSCLSVADVVRMILMEAMENETTSNTNTKK
jgi:hypothetical protein